MEIWLDTCDTKTISLAKDLGILFGVTTNPTLIAAESEGIEEMVNRLLDEQDGPLAVQVTADRSAEMIKQAVALHTFSDRIIVKVPVIREGLIAMKELVQQGISVMATAVFQPNQAILAALAGADYVAPYLCRMFDAGIDAYASLQTMLTIYQKYGFKTKVLVAALRTPDQITNCAASGVSAVTMKGPLFNQFISDDSTALTTLRAFSEDWAARKTKESELLPL
jgi:TalC/MipB family fructose-6-phosphate aldolase